MTILMSALVVAAKPATRDRAEIPARYKWDVSSIYQDWTAWEEGMKTLDAKIAGFAALKGTLAQGAQAVLRAYRLNDEIGMLQYKVYGYTHLQRDVDTRNQDVSARYQRVQALFAKAGTATSWFTPELLTVPQATMESGSRERPNSASTASQFWRPTASRSTCSMKKANGCCRSPRV